MEPEETKIKKYQFKINEVAEMVNETPATLRYWEKQFDLIKPVTNAHGTRKYTEKDIEQIKKIQYLLREKKLTIDGANQYLKNNKRQRTIETSEIVNELKELRAELMLMKKQIAQVFPDSDAEEEI